MFEDYREKVLLAYRNKREADAISMNLLYPTPAKLKAECVIVYEEKQLRKDEKFLKIFFGPLDEGTDYRQSIKKFDIDKFRPLINFLNGRTNDPEEKSIELLAWLIDFEPRPYFYGTNYKEDRETTNSPENIVFSRLKSRIKKAIVPFLLILLAGGGAYLLSEDKNQQPQQCMYWDTDHYQPVSCNEKIEDVSIIALDSTKVNHFKRIMQPDTLTAASLGKAWYVRKDGELEFYTSDGYHPLDGNNRLRPVTVFILNKYLHRD